MDNPRGLVDWELAARIAARLAAPGPVAGRTELTELVDELRDAAGRAAGHASAITGLSAADGRPPEEVSTVLVVDRPGWARANAEVFAAMTGPLAATPQRSGAARASAVQVGGVLALLAGKVLGQFDPFTSTSGHGRLLLVAPNVLHHERRLAADPSDFRLWVALHEQTHALQFAAAPWLAAHLRGRAGELMADLAQDKGALPRLGDLAQAVTRAVTGSQDGVGVLDLLSVGQRGVFEEVGAVMALLEGHADVAMDEVGPGVVPSVRAIRAGFEARRDEAARARGADRLLRRLLGLDTKLAQYRDGAAFVRAVRKDVGLTGFNAVWTSAEHLPLPGEIADPSAWVRRVHG
ncbi:zinc-dependent metalloprotease [Cellulomonas fengjieae]|uniref:Zinc-dependent metalloprotease n=1 Tax=Cellulomonas fengjieae TaxID=2819978 RepID=A0ABS3SHD0_9CELL|nr:zinc-dependent metalloprotease [Cellulomonas fengjieae]MBO3085052.1 zinc-dependent metalloprotease [Cellulomonas fengjieae]MBO3100799.1 zinc-dependent metalloprotease [Cellulomonas fengjieae]QVI66359.1 zinc-dependent metalloprotease [Cellulomonas fengjieae]